MALQTSTNLTNAITTRYTSKYQRAAEVVRLRACEPAALAEGVGDGKDRLEQEGVRWVSELQECTAQ